MINYIKCFKVLLQDLDTETSATSNWSFYSLQHNKEEYGLWLAYAKAAIVINVGRKCEILFGKSVKLKMSEAIWPAIILNGLHYRWHGVTCGFGSLHFWKGTLTTSWNKSQDCYIRKCSPWPSDVYRLLHKKKQFIVFLKLDFRISFRMCCCHHIKNGKILSLKHLQWPYFGHESVCVLVCLDYILYVCSVPLRVSAVSPFSDWLPLSPADLSSSAQVIVFNPCVCPDNSEDSV